MGNLSPLQFFTKNNLRIQKVRVCPIMVPWNQQGNQVHIGNKSFQ